MLKTNADKQTASMEDYLEAVVMLKEKGESVTVTAIGQKMGVRKSSVNWALTKLSEAGLVFHEKYRGVELTPIGASMAQDIYHRHKMLRSFLVDVLGVSPKTAEGDACRMEHLLSPDSVTRLERFVEFVLECHPEKPRWQEAFQYYLDHGCTDFKVREMVG